MWIQKIASLAMGWGWVRRGSGVRTGPFPPTQPAPRMDLRNPAQPISQTRGPRSRGAADRAEPRKARRPASPSDRPGLPFPPLPLGIGRKEPRQRQRESRTGCSCPPEGSGGNLLMKGPRRVLRSLGFRCSVSESPRPGGHFCPSLSIGGWEPTDPLAPHGPGWL